jgi:hypothetical protein
MKPKPIIMSAPMILALNSRTKKQTRRTTGLEDFNSRGEPRGYGVEKGRFGVYFGDSIADDPSLVFVACTYGGPGGKLWVREGVRRTTDAAHEAGRVLGNGPLPTAIYIADGAPAPCDRWGWKNSALPAIHMPFGMCRHFLQLTSVTVERLHAITEEDALAEGISIARANGVADPSYWWPGGQRNFATAREAYRSGWEWLNGPKSWELNPWVWRICFEAVSR